MMLIEINLLPKKKQESRKLLTSTLILALLFITAGGALFWQASTLKADVAVVENRIDTTKKLAEIEQKKSTELTEADSVSKLEQSVVWAEDYIVPSVPVMREFTSLLPERGFIQTFAYQESGTLSLTVQFDTSREAAYFLNRLNESEWVNEAMLLSLTATQKVGELETETTLNLNNDYEEEILPRYQGQFEIKLNKETVKSSVLEDEEGESGL
jgi:type IV pilus assembly protein PilN